VSDMPEDESYIDVPVHPVFGLRWASICGRHNIPTVGTLVHRKRWYSAKVRGRFLPAGQTDWIVFTTDWTTMKEIISAATLAEARTLVSFCLPDADT
jgi:hypothetical protein